MDATEISYVENVILYARAGEGVVAAITSLTGVAQNLVRIADLDPSLAPELATALAQTEDLGDTLQRAALFLATRFAVAEQRLEERKAAE